MDMLIDQIAAQRSVAAKNGDTLLRNLLGTLHAEAARIGKDARNGKSTDEEVLKTVTKFLKGAEESLKALESAGRGDTEQAEVLRQEARFLKLYLPSQMNAEELAAAVRRCIDETEAEGPKDMGKVMAALKAAHSGSYDGAVASQIVKTALAEGK